MQEAAIAVFTFSILAFASLGSMIFNRRLAVRYLQDETNATVRLVATIFVTMTSLVMGLAVNSAANTYLSIDRNIHSFATTLILLDRTLRTLGDEAKGSRVQLASYVERTLSDIPVVSANPASEAALNTVGDSIRKLRYSDEQQIVVWNDARRLFQEAMKQRWVLAEQSEGSIPLAIVVMLITWLTLIFASFGYRAPTNHIVVIFFLAASFLIAASLYLILDMNSPFSGPIQLSPAPLRRALAELTQ